MCDCKKTPGFDQKLAEAKRLTKQTEKTHVVYIHKATNSVFVRKESDLNDDLNICCYYLPDGTEVEYISTASKANEIPVIIEEIVPKNNASAKKTKTESIEPKEQG